MVWVLARRCKLQKGCTRLATTSDKVYQLLAHGQWFSPDTLASSTTKTGRHDIAEILLKVTLNTINQIKSNCVYAYCSWGKQYGFNAATNNKLTRKYL
jgi:hypothetical protein